MLRSQYYDELKALARETRRRFSLVSPRVLRSDLRRIYKTERITIDLWPFRLKKLRGAYFSDEIGATVMLAKGLPEDPTVFTMCHELKHHLVDRHLSLSYCDASNESDPIEIGAEIFAAELIYPERDFEKHLAEMGVSRGRCEHQHLVKLKRLTRTTLSYAGLAKRAEFMDFAPAGSLARIRWKKLEEELYGPPIYKRFRRR